MKTPSAGKGERRWLWGTLALSWITVVAVVFAGWELIDRRFFRGADYITIHYMYVTRGILSSLLLAFWSAWYMLRLRRQRDEHLRQSQEHYRNLVDASPGAIILLDRALEVLEWNRTAERTYGASKDEAIGKPLATLPPEKSAELETFLKQVEEGRPVLNVETTRQDSSGKKFAVQLTLLPFREGQKKLRFLEVTENIEERVRLRESMLEIEKLTSMGRMAAGTAHHLNTPLAAMLLRVEMMRERATEPDRLQDLNRLESGIRFCQHFVQRLLDFSRRRHVEKIPEEIAQTIQSIVSFLGPAMLAKKASVSLDLKAVERHLVLADPNLLEVLFSILLSNALDAIPPEGEIAITCRKSGASIEIRIRDNGHGIEAASLPHVFEPFFTTKGPGKGTGLGLAIARNIVLEHGGAIRLESQPGCGTTVTIELPVYDALSGARGEEHEGSRADASLHTGS